VTELVGVTVKLDVGLMLDDGAVVETVVWIDVDRLGVVVN